MPRLTACSLEADSMAEAFPLIRRLARVCLDQWQEFGRRLAERGGGIVAVRAEDHMVHGVAAWLPIASLRHGKALRVEAIAAFELGRSAPVRKALANALDSVARNHGCSVVLVGLDARGVGKPQSAREGWETLGLSPETIEFVRYLADPAAPAPSG